MKITSTVREIQSSEECVDRSFRIKASSTAFKILSDGLYSDKPLAIVRELCCNAYDAHVAAGNTQTPFTVHLPTYLEPYFSVKDQGIGLSRTSVEEIFTTYFESTKSESNDFIGALGLGSKSPFSYVDSFTIISCFNGVKYSFNAFMNAEEIPAIALLFQEETSDCNGVEITLPVKNTDHKIFGEKAQNVLEWFNPRPVITGNQNINFPQRQFLMSGENWRLQQHQGYQNYNQYNKQHSNVFLAIQGKIAYPINTDTIIQHLTAQQITLLNSPILVDFNIGDLEVSASRESLSFKPGTIANIKKRLDDICQQIPLKFQEEINQCQTLWDAKIKLRKLSTSYRILGDLLAAGGIQIHYRGKVLPANNMTVEFSDIPDMVINQYSSGKKQKYVGNELLKSNQLFSLYPSNDIQFVVNDSGRSAISKARLYQQSSPNISIVYLLSCPDPQKINEFLDKMGNPSVIQVSTLPAPIKATPIPKSNIRKVEKLWNGDYGFQLNSVITELEIEEGGLYVALLRNQPVDDKDVKLTNFSDIIKTAEDCGIIDKNEVIVGMNRKTTKTIAPDSEWQPFLEVLDQRFQDKIQQSNIADQIATDASFSRWNSNYSWKIQWLKYIPEFATTLGINHPLVELSNQIEAMKKVSTASLVKISQYLDLQGKVSGGTCSYDFTLEWEKILRKYPMITMNPEIRSAEQMLHLVTYCKLMD